MTMMKSRLFHAVIAGGFALAAPIAMAACGGSESGVTGSTNGGDHQGEDASGASTTTSSSSSGGATNETDHEAGAAHGDSGSDAMAHGDAHATGDAGDAGLHHDADVDADAGWPPTK